MRRVFFFMLGAASHGGSAGGASAGGVLGGEIAVNAKKRRG